MLAAAWFANACPCDAVEGGARPYTIVEGKVDRHTYNGYRRYNSACNHCHGPDGAGSSFGPSLIASPLPPDAFRAAVLYGRGEGTSVMNGFADDPNIAPYVDDIYGYLQARADGALGRNRPVLNDGR
jgi:mono/diheme cytochrome c family protein